MTVTMNTSSHTNEQLVTRIRGGDISAFEIIIERYRTALIACAYGITGSLADAEDIAQETFVQAFFHISELRDPCALPAWLRRMTERFALMHIRSQREVPATHNELELAMNNAQNASVPETTDIDNLLAQLPDSMREAVSLTFLAGYTCAEAADIMGVKEGTIKSRLSRARARLKEVFDMTDRDIAGNQPTADFTRHTIERLKREARRLIAEGKIDEVEKLADDILSEQVKPLFGDPDKLGIAKTLLTAYDNPAFQPDQEAVEMLGLPHKERRRRECEANAAQYDFTLQDLDWELADVDVMSCTLSKPTGFGKDVWGVPVSRMKLDIIDARTICQRLNLSPLTLYQWVQSGLPVLRCWPWVRFDFDRVRHWLESNGIVDWPTESEYDLERPIRVIFREVFEGRLSPEQAQEVMRCLGDGVWDAPLSIKGGW